MLKHYTPLYRSISFCTALFFKVCPEGGGCYLLRHTDHTQMSKGEDQETVFFILKFLDNSKQ